MEYINIDELERAFNSGDVITLAILKQKGLIAPSTKQMKILARNGKMLKKAFTVETQGISAEARACIKAAGGTVIITHGDKK
jgi:ribosomal protein L15